MTSNQPNQDDPDASDLIAHLVANNNTIADPAIRQISREQDGLLDPRPSSEGAAYTNPLADYPTGDDFFTPVDFSGAFSAQASEFWIAGWTSLERNGHLKLNVAVDEAEDQSIANIINIYPNPVSADTKLEIESDILVPFQIQIISQDGRILNLIRTLSGRETIDIQSLPRGLYFLKILTEDGKFYTSKLIVN